MKCSGTISLDSNELRQVEHFKYLGLIVAATATSPLQMMQARITATQKAFNALKIKCKILDVYNCRVRAQLVQSLVVSHLLFGCVVWSCMMSLEMQLGTSGTAVW